MPFLPMPRPGADLPAANAELTGTLIREGDFLRIAGNGNTIVVWPRTANARSGRIGVNTIVVWPRGARLERGGIGTVIVVWPRSGGATRRVRVGEQVTLSGIIMVDDLSGRQSAPVVMVDDISGRAATSAIITADDIAGRLQGCPRARGCTGPLFVATEFRPAPAQ